MHKKNSLENEFPKIVRYPTKPNRLTTEQCTHTSSCIILMFLADAVIELRMFKLKLYELDNFSNHKPHRSI